LLRVLPFALELRYCDISKKSDEWKKLGQPLKPGESNEVKQYRGCALAAIGDQIYGFVSYYQVNRRGDNDVVKIYPAGDGWDIETIKGSAATGRPQISCGRWIATASTRPFSAAAFSPAGWPGPRRKLVVL
jgi:hypothetical protein